ncbi:hypothetical protein MNEG_5836 [Monoraphidium neglectum]|uniref:Uncharacterized protein n=1 Tax=Monoraphidium neglectum TaxID=145388 RepID=A0A0D2MG93_9CHLO|nr:hypothetical protein MNEG_5836 [Monoraphidium neglectum]KIZ02120.1 hypothetical protein MNEG_5836 [Monoraphidium neglectum]|eukprot:XP_013901139.1 hypothetical protein MNEG_5836 [Monoraphidium neglectum]
MQILLTDANIRTHCATAGGWAGAAGQRRARHFVPTPAERRGGSFDAAETYDSWRRVWKEPPPPVHTPKPPLINKEERALLKQSAEAAGLPRNAAARVASGVAQGFVPIDPVAIAQRIRGLDELLDSPGAAARLVGRSREAPSLLGMPSQRLARQVELLRRLLPGYDPEWLLSAAPRWAAHGPSTVAGRLQELESLYARHLGAEFPRERLATRPGRWRWLFTLSERSKEVNALELIVRWV